MPFLFCSDFSRCREKKWELYNEVKFWHHEIFFANERAEKLNSGIPIQSKNREGHCSELL